MLLLAGRIASRTADHLNCLFGVIGFDVPAGSLLVLHLKLSREDVLDVGDY